jgi:hypothetical protein
LSTGSQKNTKKAPTIRAMGFQIVVQSTMLGGSSSTWSKPLAAVLGQTAVLTAISRAIDGSLVRLKVFIDTYLVI